MSAYMTNDSGSIDREQAAKQPAVPTPSVVDTALMNEEPCPNSCGWCTSTGDGTPPAGHEFPILARTVARLAPSRVEYEAEQLELGREQGIAWAATSASYKELIRLMRWKDSLSTGDWDDFFVGEVNYRWLADEINPWVGFDFWENSFGDDWNSLLDEPVFIKGFCEGAVSHFKAALPQL